MTVSDITGAEATCTSDVTVNDIVVPSASCSPFTAVLSSTGIATVTADDVNDSSSDACGVTLALDPLSPNAFACSDHGSVVQVKLDVTDPSGNQASCLTDVSVEDNSPPVVGCTSVTVELGGNGKGSTTKAAVSATSTDNW